MIIKTAAQEIKSRFATIQEKHLKRWDKENPVPEKPTVTAISKELKAGKVSINEKQLVKALGREDRYDRSPSFTDVVTTPSISRWQSATEEREAQRERFEVQLQDAKDSYLDRVLFDHENGYLLLRDFQKWRP